MDAEEPGVLTRHVGTVWESHNYGFGEWSSRQANLNNRTQQCLVLYNVRYIRRQETEEG